MRFLCGAVMESPARVASHASWQREGCDTGHVGRGLWCLRLMMAPVPAHLFRLRQMRPRPPQSRALRDFSFGFVFARTPKTARPLRRAAKAFRRKPKWQEAAFRAGTPRGLSSVVPFCCPSQAARRPCPGYQRTRASKDLAWRQTN